MNKKLLVILGQTGTGKTRLGIYLAKKFNGELISADSRQVFTGLDIGTGKDMEEVKKSGVNIWGYDLVGPKETFSVGSYIKFVHKKIDDIVKKGKLPILVGGTGLFIKGVIDGIPTAIIPPNDALRKNLEEKGADELFELLAQLDPIKAGSLNSSDKLNPRRLIRGIEIATWKLDGKGMVLFNQPKYDLLEVGLSLDEKRLKEKIAKRVEKRVAQGIEDEIGRLIAGGVTWEDQSMTSLGYRQWRDYFDRKKGIYEVMEDWKDEEVRYAKRQLAWFRRDLRINWFNVGEDGFEKKVEKLVNKWYKDGEI